VGTHSTPAEESHHQVCCELPPLDWLYKFGTILLPSSIVDDEWLGKLDSNTLWMDTLWKEIEAIRIAFEIQDADVKHLPRYKKIPGHIVWDVKMDITWKAQCHWQPSN